MSLRRFVAVLPACAVFWIAAAPACVPSSHVPLAPPDGTYVYALSRDGTDQGTATVVLTRRDDRRTFETNEAIAVGSLRARAIASYRYEDFSIASYVATYQAPFPRDSPLGRERSDFYGQTTVRYRFDGRDASATIDGVRGSLAFTRSNARVAHAWILDGPLMTGAFLLPAYARSSHDLGIAAVSAAFPPSPVFGRTPQPDRTKPLSPKTPANDKTFVVAGLVRTWYRPGNFIVDEARDVAFNLDARLVSYARAGTTAPFVAASAPAELAPLDVTAKPLTSADGTSLDGALTLPANGKRAPLVVLVPPGADATIDYGGRGPQPMYPDLARALVARGFAVLRYGTRGVGRGAASPLPTWDASLAAARAAISTARLTDGIDPARVYVLGYATGADLAIAAAASDSTPLAGVVALGPTTGTYKACPNALANEPGSWRRSALAHNPAALAARVRVPLLVFHPGVPMCDDAPDAVAAFDAALQANPRASAIAANDLSQRFGGRYDADSSADSEAIFPYRFDDSTATAITDWLTGPKTSGVPNATPASSPMKAPPPPPGVAGSSASGANPHAIPMASALPTPRPSPTQEPAPGVVLPSGETPPPAQIAPPTPSPSSDPNATSTPIVVPTPAATATATHAPTTKAHAPTIRTIVVAISRAAGGTARVGAARITNGMRRPCRRNPRSPPAGA